MYRMQRDNNFCEKCFREVLKSMNQRGEKFLEEIKALYNANINFENVHQPRHYTAGSIEVIDYIKDKLTPEQFEGYCLGNVHKYISRHKHKNGLEDLEKAKVYLGWAINSIKGEVLEK